MTALGEWLKQLVLIVLLAAFTDLLLPTKSMQKYVRMVMGLAIIAALLQPIVPLLKRDWADQAAGLAANEVLSAANNSAAADAANATASLKRELQAQTDRAADDLLAARLKTLIESTYPVLVKKAGVTGIAGGEQGLRATVELQFATSSQKAAVAQLVARELGIPRSSVSVSSG